MSHPSGRRHGAGGDPRPTTERSREGLFERNDALSHRASRPPLLSIDLGQIAELDGGCEQEAAVDLPN